MKMGEVAPWVFQILSLPISSRPLANVQLSERPIDNLQSHLEADAKLQKA